MKTKTHPKSGLSLMEVVLVIATVATLAMVYLPRLARAHAHSCKLGCVNQLKQIGLADRLWSNDHGDRFPFSASTNAGGTLEFVGSPQVFRHFQVMSNELNTPKILLCPQDTKRKVASPNLAGEIDFENLSNANISYFVGLDADESKPDCFLGGDRNLTGGFLSNGIFRISTSQSAAGWTPQIHNNAGNILLADGSVQPVTASGLTKHLQSITNLPTIRLAIP